MRHCLIFDIGKTNKKAFVFDENYHIVCEKTAQFPETTDDDGDPCEDIDLLEQWVLETAAEMRSDTRFQIKAVNCTTYGASFVYLDEALRPVAPLYNYLKPFPEDLLNIFLNKYGGAEKLSLETASPLLGNLNSGLQLYWLKHQKPAVFNRIRYALHLPQWIAMLISDLGFRISESVPLSADSEIRNPKSEMDMTSLGCHTMLWDFQKNDYHDWVKAEGLTPILISDLGFRISESIGGGADSEIRNPTSEISPLPSPQPIKSEIRNPKSEIGSGLHDSSAALIPYLASFQTPFVLISTGTWCISLNPFNDEPLTAAELAQDCLCYMTMEGKPVKAARYFGGHEHEEAVKTIARNYGVDADFYKSDAANDSGNYMDFQNALHAYGLFMEQLVQKQAASTRLAIGNTAVSRIFVDGGFSKNALYMRLLAEAFPHMEVWAAEVAQATALGAALACRTQWNTQPLPAHLIKMR